MPPFYLPKLPSILRGDDFQLSTWLALGSVLSSISAFFLPSWVTVGIPALIIGKRILWTYLHATGTIKMESSAKMGRWTAIFPPKALPSEKSDTVMFILGARTLHPMGRLAPGMKDLGQYFGAAWKEAEEDREKWGYLGRAPILYGATGDGGTTMIWLTYWKSLEQLSAFAHGASHRILWDGYLAKKWPHLGIMHETYHAGSRDWENVYYNFQPYGMGSVEFPNGDDKPVSTLREVKGHQLNSMFARLGRKDGVRIL
ncbi:hypothetical protein DM02DRAFT_604096 [Periconia macrospinosa]|uniref:DUF4188 domain-containing protein n=1 Tax=Periconia macrospinosa TaxID=97972 RepID=A0A2V1D5Q6_9PLEO|nr:hypothetical protein DM02DRAFT_604096 [Periconia macrospinosa]